MSTLTLTAPQSASRSRRTASPARRTSQPVTRPARSSVHVGDAQRASGCRFDAVQLRAPRPAARDAADLPRATRSASSTAASRATRPTSSRAASRATRGPARLTRRGRLVVLAALTLILFASLGLLGRVVAGATSDATGGPVTRTWVVQPGESLWDVAVAVDPNADPRETIARIVDLNDLPQSAVTVGQSIQVPLR